MSTADRLTVLIAGRVVGEVRRSRAGDYEFGYTEQYRREGRVPLSPSLPIGGTLYRHQQTAAYMEGLLPEKAEVRAAWAAELGTGDDAFDLLTTMGLDCVGAVQFASCANLADITDHAADYEHVTDEHLGERLRALRDNDATWTMPDEHWSLPGAQEKFTLAWLSNGWNEARGAAASTHIVKPGVHRLVHQATLEYATMQVAERLGLLVASTELRKFDGESAIVVRRFDRYERSDGGVGRLHQVDFCQAMGRFPRNKYEERGGPRTAELATMLRRESARPDVDVARFSDAVLFNYIVGAPDGHSKNFALAYSPDGRARMAPLYDLSSALAYEPRGGGYDLGKAAMSIGGRRTFGEVLRKNVERHAAEMGLEPAERVARATELAWAAPRAFHDVFESIGHDAAEQLAAKLIPRLGRSSQEFLARMEETVPSGPPRTAPTATVQGRVTRGVARGGRSTPTHSDAPTTM